ncbi:thioredoxin family protein [Chitinophaga nivalis]|uniref:Thioredoxin family protein n=1 Tax=Chitinophaga nivalis TaxID=2991709 RepID=A0ABT3II65_9BACT|nr:thioredoxin family protein [Chitinophaga nivalis]MCW3466657.1 thioredoxin family protein [Chitinophaga nivalis]MCW3483652.1 thioredoxin family protein [Chitinophaga nivalis]
MDVAIQFFSSTEIAEAMALAKSTRKPVLIDYWASNCKGCAKMKAVTYEDAEVQAYLQEHYVVVKCHIDTVSREFVKQYMTHAVLWAPSLFVYAPDGTILRTIIGYVSPRRFITDLSIGAAALQMRQGKHAAALKLLGELPYAATYPELDQEAMYWEGVAAFWAYQRNVDRLIPYWNRLRDTYPDSTWAEKADVFPE